MAKPDILDAFKAMNFEEQASFLKDANNIHEDGKAAKRAELMAQLQALGGIPSVAKAPRSSGTRASPKVTHRGPNGEEWRSRGQKPKWLQALIAQGRDENEFRVSE